MPEERGSRRTTGVFHAVNARHIVLIAATLLATGGHPAVADSPDPIPSGVLSAEMRAHDPRLERKVTLNESALCLGELIDRLAEQAKVPLACPDDEPVSGEPVTLFIKERPLADVLNGLYYLFSYRGAEWQWQPMDKNGTPLSRDTSPPAPPTAPVSPAFGYRFSPTKAALKFAASIRGAMQAGFERQVEEMIACLGRSQDELKKDPRPAIQSLADPRVAEGVAALAEGLNASQRQQLLRGGRGVTLSGASLGPSGQRFLQKQRDRDEANAREIALKVGSRSGNRPPQEGYNFLRFDARRFNQRMSLGPSHLFGFYPAALAILFGDVKTESSSVFTLISREDVERDAWKRMDALWPFPTGDPNTPPLPDPLPQALYGRNVESHSASEAERAGQKELQSFAQGAKVPVLARLTYNAWGAATPGTRSAKDFLLNLREGGECGVAWRDGMLLVCRHDWVRPRYSAPLVPWSILKRLRADIAADPQRLLPVEDLFFAAARLTPTQMWRLEESEKIQGLEAVSGLHNLLAPLDRDKRRKERFLGKGLPVAALRLSPPSPQGPGSDNTENQEDSAVQRAYAAFSPPVDYQSEQFTRLVAALSASPNGTVRLRVTDAPQGQPPRRRVELVLLPSAGVPETILAAYEWEPTSASSSGAPSE